MLLLITATRGRPRAFEALKKWTSEQTAQEWDWLVVSDDYADYKFPKGAKLIKRDNSADTLPSICHNYLAALDYMAKNERYDAALILDDDDWYHREYVFESKKLLDKAELIGWHEDAYYYVLNRKARRVHNVGFAALAATGFKRSVLPYLTECCEAGNVFIDSLLWEGQRQTTLVPQPPLRLPDGNTMNVPPVPFTTTLKEFKGKKLLADNFTGHIYGTREQPRLDKHGNIAGEHPRHVGMKENWHGGQEGLSGQHNPNTGGGPDWWGDQLKRWIGEEDANYYLKITSNVYDELRPPKRSYAPGLVLTLPVEQDR